MPDARGFVHSIEEATKRIRAIGGAFNGRYSYTDIVFLPKSGIPDLNKEYVRVKAYKKTNLHTKKFVVFHKLAEWDGKTKTDKISLKREFDTLGDAIAFVKEHFNAMERGFDYFRMGREYHLGAAKIYAEDIRGFRPTIEVEAESRKELESILGKLGVTELLADSIPETMRKILNRSS